MSVPALFYFTTEASVELFRENAIEATFMVDEGQINDHLDIFTVLYALNGTLLGEYPFSTGLLQVCPDENTIGAFRFGRLFYQSCQTGLEKLKRWNRGFGLVENVFQELFIRFKNSEGKTMVILELKPKINKNKLTTKVYPLPILNENIRDRSDLPNRVPNLQRDSRVIITRRFFMLDSEEEYGGGGRTLIRIPESISLHIHLQVSVKKALT